MIETRKREHSRKPDEQYELIEACSPGPRLELFARHPAEGWTAWGDESEIAPRGRAHRGYQGGDIVRPADPKPSALSTAYRAGQSIRELSESTGLSIRRVRELLREGGTDLRGRGRPALID